MVLYSLRMSCIHTIISNLPENTAPLQALLDQEEKLHQKILMNLDPVTASEAHNLLNSISSKIVDNERNMHEWSQLALTIVKRIEEGNVHGISIIARDFILRVKCMVYDSITGATEFQQDPFDVICLNSVLDFDISSEEID